MEEVLIQIRVPKDLRKALRAYCNEHETSMTRVLKRLLEEFLEKVSNEKVGSTPS
jgi:hypothetical protein